MIAVDIGICLPKSVHVLVPCCPISRVISYVYLVGL